MKKVYLLIFLSILFSICLKAQDITVAITPTYSYPGAVVNVPVTYNALNGKNSIVGLEFYIEYDRTNLVPYNEGFTNFCSYIPRSNWLFSSNYSSNKMAITMAIVTPVTIPNGTVLFEMTFTYTGTVKANIEFDALSTLLDGDFEEPGVNFLNGYVLPLEEHLAAPVLIAPENNATNEPLNITLLWNPVADATFYEIQIATDSTFETLITNTSVDVVTAYQCNDLDFSLTYYWHIRAKNQLLESEWSEVWNFTTMTEQEIDVIGTISSIEAKQGDTVYIPVIFSGLNANNSPKEINLKFDYDTTKLIPIGSGFTDLIDLIPDSNWIANPFFDENTMSITAIPENLISIPNDNILFKLSFEYIGTSNTTISFNTESFILNGNSNELILTLNNGMIMFKENYLSSPILNSPANNSIDISINPNLIWNEVENATSYSIQVATSVDFSNPIINLNNILETNYNLSNLSYSTMYYWRVKAQNATLTSDWSDIWHFTTINETVIEKPVLSQPANNEIDIPVNPNLTWNEVEGATGYSLQVSKNADMSDSFVDIVNLTETNYNLSALSFLTTYFWRVKASNIIQSSDWTDIWNFTTQMGASVLDAKSNKQLISAFPNPANDFINIEFFANNDANVNIIITNSIGENVKEFSYSDLQNGINNFNLNLSELPSGVYIISVFSKTYPESHKFTIIR